VDLNEHIDFVVAALRKELGPLGLRPSKDGTEAL
jgi:hypothetical protein